MKKLATILTVGWALLAPLTSSAAGTTAGRFASEEIGAASCRTYLEAKSKKSSAYGNYVSFVEGYLTAANRYEPNTYDLTPWHNSAAFALILDQHCRSNAADTLTEVSQKLVRSMMPLRLTEPSRFVDIKEGSNRTRVYEAILKRAQGALAKKGLYQGPSDGQFTLQTKSALQTFQKSAKLDPTGLPDPATLWVLLNP